MEKVFGWLSQKNSKQNTAFQEQIYETAKTLNPEKIQNCALSYIEYFSTLPLKELLEQPIKKECNLMLTFMIPEYIKKANSKEDCNVLFKCISSASAFIPIRSNYSDLLYSLLVNLLKNRSNQHFLESKQLLQNMLNNNSFTDFIVKDSTLVYLYACSPQEPIIFEFLRSAVLKSSISSEKNYKQIISSIINTIETSLPESIIFIGALYKKFGKCVQFESLFDYINMKILTIKNIDFYEDVAKVVTSAPFLIQTKFENLCEMADADILEPILDFVLQHSEFNNSIVPLLEQIKHMKKEEQEIYFKLVQRDAPQRREYIITKMFPPWKYSVDCEVLANYAKNFFTSEMAERFLLFMIAETKFDKQCSAFENIPHFADLYITLFQLIDEYDNIETYFSNLVKIAYSGHSVVVNTIEGFLKCFPPVTYHESLICSLEYLVNVPEFPQILSKLMIEIAELKVDLLCTEFIEVSIKQKQIDWIAILASDGPYKIIDDEISKLFDQYLKDLTQEQLQKLAYGVLQNSSAETGTIRIPSILPKLTTAKFSTLFDRYVAGRYLIENNLITIDSPILPEIGVQCLSEKIASQLIDKPELLEKVTNPIFPHRSVIQFQEDKEDSFLTIGEIPLSFSFRVDSFKKPFILFTASGYSFAFDGISLTCNNSNVICCIGQWHSIDLYFPGDRIDVHVNGHRAFYFTVHDDKSPIIIGSTNIPPGSTFYVKNQITTNDSKKEAISYQAGLGVLNVDYTGIAVYAPLINAVPRLLQKLLIEKDEKSFENIFLSLLNIESFDCVSLSVNDFLGFIRVILCERNDMVTSSIITNAFSFVCENGSIDWQRFKRLFIDYRLWISCYKTMTPVLLTIEQIIDTQSIKPEEAEYTSLIHFLIDLIVYCDVKDDKLEDLIICIAKKNIFSKSSLIIHLLNKEPSPFISRMVNEIPGLLESVPFQYMPQMSHNLAMQYFMETASACCHNENTFKCLSINKMLPLLADYVLDQNFWISMFTLLTKTKYDSITLYNESHAVREEMLHPMFVLLCDLYKADENSKILFTIIDTLNSIIKISNIRLSNYTNDLQLLLHFGLSSTTLTSMPIVFDTFEPGRIPSEDKSVEDQIIDLVDSIEISKYRPPSADDFIGSTDLWFGLPSTPFIEACEKGGNSIKYDEIQEGTENEEENLDKEVKIITESQSHSYIVDIVAKALAELKGEALSTALKQTTLFGPEVEPKLSIKLHQQCILKLLSLVKAPLEVLRFTREMICVGWWEDNLQSVFNAIINSFEQNKIEEVEEERWNELIETIRSILSLSTECSNFNFVQFAPIIFNKQIITRKDYLLFIVYVLMITKFATTNLAQTTWISLLNTLGSVDDSLLSSFFEGVFISKEGIAEQFHELLTRTKYLTEISENDLQIVTTLKNKCKQEYEAFIKGKNEEMKELTMKVRNIRQAVKETSDEYNNALVGIVKCSSLNTGKHLRYIERFSFRSRFNLVSHENERSSYHLWSIIPRESDKFQLCPTVHPLSTPILYVPLSSKIDASNPTDYCEYEKHKRTTKIGNDEVTHSFAPPTLDSFVSMPFFETNPELHNFLFRASFRHYGQINSFSKLTIVFGTMRVKCALANAERGFYIITEAKSVNGKLMLKANKPNLAVVTFLDALAYKYYGSCSLFYGHCVLFMSVKHVVNVVPRNYCHVPTAIEVWFARGYSLFLVFTNEKERDEFAAKLNHREYFPPSKSLFGPSFSNRLCNIVGKPKELKKLSEEWVLGTLSSQTYLSCLNFLADRSFSNFCQYPVMPWILPQRNMAKPMGQQTKERAADFQETYESSKPDYHFYGSHYSTAAVVMHFLMRIQPFSNLHFELQNGFDHKDRLFSDIEKEWKSSSEISSHNVEELIPEFFLLPEALTNVNKLPIPESSRNICQDSVALPPETPNPVAFVWWMRKTLDDNENLEKWINLIFGAFSRGNEAVIHKNLFYPCTYGVKSSIADDEAAFEQMKRCFGQTPTQLFTEPHPARNTVCFKRTPLLLDQKVIFTQIINTESKEVKDPIVIKTRTSFGIESCATLYASLSHSPNLTFSDTLLTWKSFTIDDLVTSCFSIEKLLFCGVFSSGAMQICRSICREDGSIIGYYPLSSCPIPSNIHICGTITCCAISSHHFVACEATGNNLYCFHVGTGHFIRKIETGETIKSVHIDDSFSCFYIFCVSSIEIFTINGTFVGKTVCESPIISSSISCNDVDVFAATAHKDGIIRFWRADAVKSVVKCIKTVEAPDKDIISIELLRGGSVLVSVNRGNIGVVFVSSGVGKGIISNSSAAKCASCRCGCVKLHECQSCGLYYCDKCCTPTPGTICHQCLQEIEGYQDFDI